MFLRLRRKINAAFASYVLTVTFHMKSGDKIAVLCDDVKITFTGTELTGYDLVGLKKGSAMYLRLDDISAITYVYN